MKFDFRQSIFFACFEGTKFKLFLILVKKRKEKNQLFVKYHDGAIISTISIQWKGVCFGLFFRFCFEGYGQ